MMINWLLVLVSDFLLVFIDIIQRPYLFYIRLSIFTTTPFGIRVLSFFILSSSLPSLPPFSYICIVVHNFHVSESMLESLAIAAILGSSETLKVFSCSTLYFCLVQLLELS